MTRAYLRIDPNLVDEKEADGYNPSQLAAFIALLCEAEKQAPRGRFKNLSVLRAHLGRHARQLPFLLEQKDLELWKDGRYYVVGWDEWQEGDWQVAERMKRVNAQRGRPPTEVATGAARTANWRLRTRVFERDAYTCRYCGDTEYDRQWLVMEHVVPDGPDTFENLVTSCRPCNKKKGSRTPEQAGMALLPVPGDVSPGDSDASHVTDHGRQSGERRAESGERRAESGEQALGGFIASPLKPPPSPPAPQTDPSPNGFRPSPVPGRKATVDEIADVLRRRGKRMTSGEVAAKLQADLRSVYGVLGHNPAVFRQITEWQNGHGINAYELREWTAQR